MIVMCHHDVMLVRLRAHTIPRGGTVLWGGRFGSLGGKVVLGACRRGCIKKHEMILLVLCRRGGRISLLEESNNLQGRRWTWSGKKDFIPGSCSWGPGLDDNRKNIS